VALPHVLKTQVHSYQKESLIMIECGSRFTSCPAGSVRLRVPGTGLGLGSGSLAFLYADKLSNRLACKKSLI